MPKQIIEGDIGKNLKQSYHFGLCCLFILSKYFKYSFFGTLAPIFYYIGQHELGLRWEKIFRLTQLAFILIVHSFLKFIL